MLLCTRTLWIVCSLCSLASAQAAARPNIVILYADDMGWGDLGVQNADSKIPTPHLDQLAREGTRFTDAHSSSGICTPSRYALLSGRYHWRKFHGIVNSFDQPVMDDERMTLAEMIKQRGYRTACIGKWHLGWDWNAIRRPGAQPTLANGKAFAPDAFDWHATLRGGPLDHGFDTYFGDDVPNFPPYAWFEDDRIRQAPTVSLEISAQTAEGSWEARPGPAVPNWDFHKVMPELTRRAEAWIEQQTPEQPFFLYFAFTSPHAPIVPSPEFTGRSQANGYGDFVMQTDDAVGRVLRALDARGLRDNTLVIFTSDNGPEHYAYNRVKNYQHRSMGPLRGLKRDLWEGGHRVPFVVRWPGQIEANRVSDELLSQIDIFATLAAVLVVDLPAGCAEDSYNQLPLWTGSSRSQRETLVHNTNPGRYALRHNDWVLIDAPTGGVTQVPAWFDEVNHYTANTQPGELYDVSQDVEQRHNLYAQQQAVVEQLQSQLKQIQAQGQVR